MEDRTDETVDVVVVGMGPGGEEVAGRLAEAGLDVIGVESGLVGGECPYWGCIPSKMMVRAANLVAEGGPPRSSPGCGARARSGRGWRAGSVRRPTGGTTGRREAVRREGRPPSYAAGGAWTARAWIVDGTPWRPAGPSCWPPGAADDPAGARTPRHAVLDQPRGRGGGAGTGLPARARGRCRRTGDGPGLRTVRHRGRRGGHRPSPARRRGAGGRCAAGRGARFRGNPVHLSAEVSTVRHDDGRFTSCSPMVTGCRPTASWCPPGRHPTSVPSAWPRSASTRPPAPCRWTTDCGCRGWSGCGRSATSPARGRSPTYRCTRPTSCVRDILDRPVHPADYRAMPRVTFTDPEVGCGRPHRAGRTGGRHGRPGRLGRRRGIGPRVDPRTGNGRTGQAGRGCRTRHPGGGDVGRSGRR